MRSGRKTRAAGRGHPRIHAKTRRGAARRQGGGVSSSRWTEASGAFERAGGSTRKSGMPSGPAEGPFAKSAPFVAARNEQGVVGELPPGALRPAGDVPRLRDRTPRLRVERVVEPGRGSVPTGSEPTHKKNRRTGSPARRLYRAPNCPRPASRLRQLVPSSRESGRCLAVSPGKRPRAGRVASPS